MDEKTMKETAEKVSNKFMNMSNEELMAELEKHKYGDVERMLMYAWDPEMKDDYWKNAPPTTAEAGKE
jgi:hypothetical protein